MLFASGSHFSVSASPEEYKKFVVWVMASRNGSVYSALLSPTVDTRSCVILRRQWLTCCVHAAPVPAVSVTVEVPQICSSTEVVEFV